MLTISGVGVDGRQGKVEREIQLDQVLLFAAMRESGRKRGAVGDLGQEQDGPTVVLTLYIRVVASQS